MKKFLSLMILSAALFVSGCGGETIVSQDTPDDITFLATDAGNFFYARESLVPLTIPEGSGIHVDASISSGKFIITIEGKEYEIDKTSEFFIDVPAGERDVFMAAKSGLTGKIVLTVVPKN